MKNTLEQHDIVSLERIALTDYASLIRDLEQGSLTSDEKEIAAKIRHKLNNFVPVASCYKNNCKEQVTSLIVPVEFYHDHYRKDADRNLYSFDRAEFYCKTHLPIGITNTRVYETKFDSILKCPEWPKNIRQGLTKKLLEAAGFNGNITDSAIQSFFGSAISTKEPKQLVLL